MHFVILVNGLFIFAQRERERDLISFIVTYPGIIVAICFQETRKCIVKVESHIYINMVHTSFKKP